MCAGAGWVFGSDMGPIIAGPLVSWSDRTRGSNIATERSLQESNTRVIRGLLVGGGVLVWIIGLLWVLNRKGIVNTPVFSSAPAATADGDEAPVERSPAGSQQPQELVIEVEAPPEPVARMRPAAETDVALALVPEPVEDAGPPTYPVWFESERSIGVCKISYEGGSKTANLHVSTRLPEGKLSFGYQCGKHSGRASIDVKPKRVNGVLFCQDGGGVSVKTVRSKDGRCARR